MVVWKVKGFFKADAETVYKEITALGDSFSPEQIVEAAKNEKSELHKCFTWDDTVAAENWRKHQARVLVAQLVVKTETSLRGSACKGYKRTAGGQKQIQDSHRASRDIRGD